VHENWLSSFCVSGACTHPVLRRWRRSYREKISGARADRPQLAELIASLKEGAVHAARRRDDPRGLPMTRREAAALRIISAAAAGPMIAVRQVRMLGEIARSAGTHPASAPDRQRSAPTTPRLPTPARAAAAGQKTSRRTAVQTGPRGDGPVMGRETRAAARDTAVNGRLLRV
jgi:hypothetical protein